MSRKHYTEVAEILRYARGHADNEGEESIVGIVARDLALMFKRDNPRFNAGKFFDAAGFPELTATRMGLN